MFPLAILSSKLRSTASNAGSSQSANSIAPPSESHRLLFIDSRSAGQGKNYPRQKNIRGQRSAKRVLFEISCASHSRMRSADEYMEEGVFVGCASAQRMMRLRMLW